ncbi:sensor histidine kinase [Neobacillus sp. 19]|uniref:sensor histidine kinase n=1 Tax=Neobacillus sp. 19 TaxID=3394458 RepID=UPI003BF6A9AE
MHSISKRLSLLFILCTIAAILLVTLFVNVTVTNKFNQYMVDIQNKRYHRIVAYLEDVYKREGNWSENTGVELMHEAYMGNYCLTLMDENKQPVWGMNPNAIKTQLNMDAMPVQGSGVYTIKSFAIKVDSKTVGYVDIGQYSSILLSEEDVNFKDSINKSIIASGVLTLIIISVFSLFFSRQLSNPIKEVAKMSVNLSKGNFETQPGIRSNLLELEELQKSVNILAGKLKYQDTLRRRLVSNITHEIRTPLNVLQNNLEAMIDGVYPVTTEKLNYLNEEVIRFGKLITGLHMLKEFETESAKLSFETIYLDEFIPEICKDFNLDAEKKNINLKYSIEPNHKYLITGDKDQLKQVFINLFSNAIKFTEPDGRVLVNLYEDDKNIVVEVCDNGIGIHVEDLPYIFERLFRGDKSRQKIEGKGIGLTIVKSILQLHNASIDVESKVGLGTKFTLYFTGNEKS